MNQGAMPAYPDWRPIETAPEGVEVWTKIDDEHGVRNVQSMTRKGRLWHFPDMSMYVYYIPTHWAALSDQPIRQEDV